MQKLWQFILQEIFPNYCLLCHEKSEEPICSACLKNSLKYYGESQQLQLGYPYLALFEYSDSIKKIIEALKYTKNLKLLPCLQKAILENAPKYNVDMIIPVPLHPNRQKERGFNQAEELIKLYAQFHQIPIRTDLVYRGYQTKKSADLNAEERIENTLAAFQVWQNKQHELKDKSILIFDDILTTGNTIKSIIKVIEIYQPKNINILGFSRPLWHASLPQLGASQH